MWKNERFLWEKGAGDTRCGIFLKNIETLWRKWSHSKLNAEKSLTLFSALFFYLFQGLKWEKRGDEW